MGVDEAGGISSAEVQKTLVDGVMEHVQRMIGGAMDRGESFRIRTEDDPDGVRVVISMASSVVTVGIRGGEIDVDVSQLSMGKEGAVIAGCMALDDKARVSLEGAFANLSFTPECYYMRIISDGDLNSEPLFIFTPERLSPPPGYTGPYNIRRDDNGRTCISRRVLNESGFPAGKLKLALWGHRNNAFLYCSEE